MDKKLFVIAIAVGTATLTMLLSAFMPPREVSPQQKRLLWLSIATGIVALVGMAMILLGR